MQTGSRLERQRRLAWRFGTPGMSGCSARLKSFSAYSTPSAPTAANTSRQRAAMPCRASRKETPPGQQIPHKQLKSRHGQARTGEQVLVHLHGTAQSVSLTAQNRATLQPLLWCPTVRSEVGSIVAV